MPTPQENVPYIGSGPYCYSNALAMIFGANSPSTPVIEFAFCSAFGMQFLGQNTVFFDPYGWDPMVALDDALSALGWRSNAFVGTNAEDALLKLETEVQKGPVFVGPLEMGLLRHQPDMHGAIGADHYVVVLGVDRSKDEVIFHDPSGFPFATLPIAQFMQAWKAEKIAYGKPYSFRSNFCRFEVIAEEDAIRRSLANARKWLSMNGDHDMPLNSVGNASAALRLAAIVEKGISSRMRGDLVFFGVRVGARRVLDAATCLARIECHEAAAIMRSQAQLIGSLQYPLVVGDKSKAALQLRALASTYEELRNALDEILSDEQGRS